LHGLDFERRDIRVLNDQGVDRERFNRERIDNRSVRNKNGN
jgi:hypothetical protein